jgi:hypothetical protein
VDKSFMGLKFDKELKRVMLAESWRLTLKLETLKSTITLCPQRIDYLIGIPMHSPGLFGSDIEPLIILER